VSGVWVDFCGEIHPVTSDRPVIIGRGGDLEIDDNPYLHRRFLEVSWTGSMVWLANVGTQLSATVSDQDGLMQAWLRPGAQVPLVFSRTVVWFTAGPTTYEFEVHQDEPSFHVVAVPEPETGGTTIGRMTFTPDQKLLILALAEHVLRRGDRGAGTIPSSAEAARRLGWTITKLNRKLDNVCQKVARAGVRGLHGNADQLAANRKARLVEYAVAARLVVPEDLVLLDALRAAPDG
jgi:hypothetical protein